MCRPLSVGCFEETLRWSRPTASVHPVTVTQRVDGQLCRFFFYKGESFIELIICLPSFRITVSSDCVEALHDDEGCAMKHW